MFRILIAEDDPSTARLLCAIVKRAGYEPLSAADGVQALEMLDHNHIDLLLCDVMMPRICLLYTSDAADEYITV